MFPRGLSMLWESTDPAQALRDRFGFDDADQAARWLAEALAEWWAIDVQVCDRLMISGGNAIAWVQTDHGALVTKWSSSRREFAKLAATADLIHRLGQQGLPVAPPLSAVDGARRVIVPSVLGELSVTVQPAVPGEILDVTDSVAVHDAGACLAKLHRALSTYDLVLLSPDSHPVIDLRGRVETWLDTADHGRTRAASTRLRAQLGDLPEIDTPAQLVHCDYRAGNILTVGSRITAVLDFDEVSVDCRVTDLAHAAVVLSTRFTDWRPTSRAVRETLLAGYRSVQPLTAAEEQWLEPLILWRGIGQVPPGEDPDGWAASVSISG